AILWDTQVDSGHRDKAGSRGSAVTSGGVGVLYRFVVNHIFYGFISMGCADGTPLAWRPLLTLAGDRPATGNGNLKEHRMLQRFVKVKRLLVVAAAAAI